MRGVSRRFYNSGNEPAFHTAHLGAFWKGSLKRLQAETVPKFPLLNLRRSGFNWYLHKDLLRQPLNCQWNPQKNKIQKLRTVAPLLALDFINEHAPCFHKAVGARSQLLLCYLSLWFENHSNIQ